MLNKITTKIVSMIREKHNYTLHTKPWHPGEEPQNTNEFTKILTTHKVLGGYLDFHYRFYDVR